MTNTAPTITRAQAAEQLGVSLRTVNRYMRNGELTFERDTASGRVSIHADSPALRTAPTN